MPLFLSTTTNKIDKKGRLSVPVQFRANIGVEAFQGIVIYPSFKHDCLHGTDMGYMERLSDSIHGDFGLYSDENEALATSILAASNQLAFDPEGRVTLPKAMLDHAGISEQATFVGLGSTFQVWQPHAYEKFREKQLDVARQQARNLRPVPQNTNKPDKGDG